MSQPPRVHPESVVRVQQARGESWTLRVVSGLGAASLLASLLSLLASPALGDDRPSWRVVQGDVRVTCPLTVGGSFEAKTSTLTGALAFASLHPAVFTGNLAVDLKTLDTGPITNHVNIVRNANGMFAYVTIGGLNEIKVFRTDNFEHVATIPVGKLPHGIWPSGDGTRVYVGLENEDKVAAIDTLKNEVIATSPIGQAPQALVYVPDAVPAVSKTELGNDQDDGRPRRTRNQQPAATRHSWPICGAVAGAAAPGAYVEDDDYVPVSPPAVYAVPAPYYYGYGYRGYYGWRGGYGYGYRRGYRRW
jgi:YVTN family beta-propeller protein